MQHLLERLYDARSGLDVQDFLLTDRGALGNWSSSRHDVHRDEQVFVAETEEGLQLGLFLEEGVLDRLENADPHLHLHDGNLADFCTALEGVSHLLYLAYCAFRQRCVSLLELELQAEVDKYAGALILLTEQAGGRFPAELHARLFHQVSFMPHLDAEEARRYRDANRWAARFCRSLDERFLSGRRIRPEAWLLEMRRFYHASQTDKIRHATR
jgi:hypothetical protein